MASALALSQVIARLSALEAKVTSLETENLLLKRALLSAPSPAAPAPAGKGKKAAAAAGEKKAHSGPVAWNEEVLSVWKEMATEAGVDVSEEATWRKEAQALGIGRTEAMKEASSRRGPKPAAPPKKISEKPSAPAASAAAAPKASLKKGPAAAAPKPSAEETAKAEFEALDLTEAEIDGIEVFCAPDGQIFSKAGQYSLGKRLGMLTAEGGIDREA